MPILSESAGSSFSGDALFVSDGAHYEIAHRPRLAVSPFTNLSGDQSQDYFSDGLTEEMIAQLGRRCASHVGVLARTSSMSLKNKTKTACEIGEWLHVEYLVEGSGHVPFMSLVMRRHELPPRHQPVLVVADGADRASQGAETLAGYGFADVAFLEAPWSALGSAVSTGPPARGR